MKNETRKRILFILLPFLLIFIAAGTFWAWRAYKTANESPGVGVKAERGYQACEPVIAALSRYYEEKGSYPETLEALVPAYLSEIPKTVNDMPILYGLTEQSYTLEFSYVGPGMNHCSYTPELHWKCYGFY